MTGCTGKAAYISSREARSFMRRTAHNKQRVYHCQGCGLFHATTMTSQTHKRVTRRVA